MSIISYLNTGKNQFSFLGTPEYLRNEIFFHGTNHSTSLFKLYCVMYLYIEKF